MAGKLLEMPVKPRIEATFSTSAGTCDLLDPVFALDGNDATFYKSARSPPRGDHFTVTFKEPQLVHAIEVLTGINSKGLLDGGAGAGLRRRRAVHDRRRPWTRGRPGPS